MSIPCKMRPLGVGLPVGYKRVEYLESTGTQHIDTEYVPNNETGLLLDAKPEAPGDTIPFGSRNTGLSESRFYAVRPRRPSGNHLIANGYGWGGWFTIGTGIDGVAAREKTTLNWKNDRKAKCEAGAIDISALLFEPKCSMFLFAANIDNTPALQFTGKIWEAAISQGKSIAMSFVPCLDPNNRPCMFDTVSKKPFYNAATTGSDFLYG